MLNLDARIFYTAYCLDKLMCLNVGRPSAIRDADFTVSQKAIRTNTPADLPKEATAALSAFSGLAVLLSELQTSLFTVSATNLSTVEALHKIGRADGELLRWQNSLEPELRPTNETPFKSSQYPQAAFIHLIYHQT